MKTYNFSIAGENERIFLRRFCEKYNFNIIKITDPRGQEPYEGIIEDKNGNNILVEVKIRNNDEYKDGIMLEKQKYLNLIKYQDTFKCIEAYYISVFNNCLTIIEINKINPVWFTKQLPKTFFDRTYVDKEIAYVIDYVRIEDEELVSYIYNIINK